MPEDKNICTFQDSFISFPFSMAFILHLNKRVCMLKRANTNAKTNRACGIDGTRSRTNVMIQIQQKQKLWATLRTTTVSSKMLSQQTLY